MDERRPPGIEESYEHEMRLIGPDGGDGLRAYLEPSGARARIRYWTGGWRSSNHIARRWRGSPNTGRIWIDSAHGCSRSWKITTRFCRRFALTRRCRMAARSRSGTFQGFSYTMTHNLTGWPAAVVRCGQTAAGLPIGVQIAAHPWREDVALRIAGRLEELCGGWQRSRPYNRCERSYRLDPGTRTDSRVAASPARRHSGCTCRRLRQSRPYRGSRRRSRPAGARGLYLPARTLFPPLCTLPAMASSAFNLPEIAACSKSRLTCRTSASSPFKWCAAIAPWMSWQYAQSFWDETYVAISSRSPGVSVFGACNRIFASSQSGLAVSGRSSNVRGCPEFRPAVRYAA